MKLIYMEDEYSGCHHSIFNICNHWEPTRWERTCYFLGKRLNSTTVITRKINYAVHGNKMIFEEQKADRAH